ncbi:PIN domain-containing protein [Thermaerobacter subterraneus]|uniref:Ribonuclease VapC n=1 Tax=Thermaerobacter subterraneus DSM 13965 TaxID=867903 RepID=K6QCY3_9FIRM|nr:PIN domain-containing protein [Thermaerobacter subterraneus]EKP94461.1 putative nucleic acid-binding protein [Thermaerobacter subterraneus DSM 13965]
MSTWLLDANVVVYCLAREHILANPQAAHLHERLEVLDRALERAIAAGHRLRITPVVVAETLYVLEGAYGYSPAEAVAALLQFVRAPEVDVEDEEAVLAGLRHHAAGQLDFVDGYLAARTADEDVFLLTNDRAIARFTDARVVQW